MKPQPPVTKMRIAARTSSAVEGALAVSPTLRDSIATWRTTLAEMDWTPWMIVAVGAFLRVLLLAIKPPHFDEGINGWFVDQMTKTGFYRYDPTNYHGPLHFYILFLSQTLFGRNLWALRMPVVLGSISCIWLTLRYEPIVGRTVSRWAAIAMAVSPAYVFYGRYSIHEVWLLLSSMLFILGLLGLWRLGDVKYLWCAGLGTFGMILTKETYIIHVGCAVAAVVVTWVTHLMVPAEPTKCAEQKWTYIDVIAVLAVGIAAVIFFYSGTFLNWPGVKGLYLTFEAWFKTGSNGNGHEKPWHYWLMLIARYEPPILLGLLASGCCLLFRNAALRFLAIYGVGTLMAYSIVAYKTPWCIISIVWPLLFIFGLAVSLAPQKLRASGYAAFAAVAAMVAIGYAMRVRKEAIGFEYAWPFIYIAGALLLLAVWRSRRVTQLALAATAFVSLALSIHLNYFRCSTDTEPYVYVQTYNDVFTLSKPLLQLAERDPRAYQLAGHMIRQSAYPFPWILGDFTRIGYYEKENLPTPLDADFLLVQEDKIAAVEPQLRGSYYTMPLRIRPYQDTSKLYLSAKVFADFFPGRVPDFAGHE